MQIKEILKKILFTTYPIKIILFESSPDYSDNTKMVYDEMIKRGLNRKYRMVWLAFDGETRKCPNFPNTIAVEAGSWKHRFYRICAKVIISCNRILPSYVEGQYSIHLTHGVPFKDTSAYMIVPKNLSCYLCTSKQDRDVTIPKLCIPDYIDTPNLGAPRVDDFCKPRLNLGLLFQSACKNFIIWYPTFRNSKYGKRNDGGFALPLLHNEHNAIKLNEKAKEKNTLIIIKPHPVQDLSKMKRKEFSNIVFIDDDFFYRNHISNYQFLNSCDALITDYSSVFIDYLIVDRPIGLIWEDIEDYKQNPGLMKNYHFLAQGCEKVYNVDDLCRFVEKVSEGVDTLHEQRRVVREHCHYTYDGKNTERVLDYILSEAKL